MQIAGLQKTTLVDYPGKVACTVFTPGCNFRCGYCQNPALVENKGVQLMAEEQFFSWLKTRSKWLDGVCVTGGEPTLHTDLPKFAATVKRMGFLFKLDTNGSNPTMLEGMLDAGLADYVAMDIKAPLEKYDLVASVRVDKAAIRKSAELIMSRAPDYEFRTTVAPGWYSMEDAVAIGKWLSGAKAYYLQQFVPDTTLDPEFGKKRRYESAELAELADAVRPYFGAVGIR